MWSVWKAPWTFGRPCDADHGVGNFWFWYRERWRNYEILHKALKCPIVDFFASIIIFQERIAMHLRINADWHVSFYFPIPLSLPPSHCSSADYVYFENSSSNPLLIRRIEELNKVSVCVCACACVWGWICALECNTDLTAVHQLSYLLLCFDCIPKA